MVEAKIFKFRSKAQIAEDRAEEIVVGCRARTEQLLKWLEEPTPRTILGTRMEDGDAIKARFE
jgi:hypothetical protein